MASSKKVSSKKKTKSTKAVKKTPKVEEVEVITISERSITLFLAIVLSGALIAAAIYLGLKNGNTARNINSKTAQTQNNDTKKQGNQLQKDDNTATVSVDDDARKGNKDAKVAIVEFSDFECPYCHRYFQQTYPKIMKDYVDTGKVIYVFRDLPLSFHDPAATTEALAAECVHHALGDEAYFKYHDKIFSNSKANGGGVEDGALKKWAEELGMSGSDFDKCLSDKKYQDEINKDSSDANAVGISGTPSFVIGVIDDKGNVTGEKLVGAQPYSVFKTTIDKYLAQVK